MSAQDCKNGLVTIIEAIGNLPNTFWGILVLFTAMHIAVAYNSDIGYYFAGVGSTLLGIAPNHSPNTKFTTSTNPQSLKVETNASDTPSSN